MKEELNQFRIQRERLGGLISRASELVDILKMSGASENLAKLSTKVNNDSFKIQVVGTFKNGKSTFINSLLGEEVLPAYALPTTAVINEVKYGKEKRAVLYFRNPLPDKLPSSIPARAMQHIRKHQGQAIPPLEVDYNEIEDYVVIPMGEDPAEMLLESPYEKVELFWPLDLLKEGVEIVDSPGLNEAVARTKVTLDYLTKADAILLVLTADKLCSMDEMDFVENDLAGNGFTDPFFIVNRFDCIAERERERIRSFAKHKLGKFSTNEIYYVSALQSLNGQIDDDEKMVKASGMPIFTDRLSTFLTKDKGRIKLSQPMRELKRIVVKECLYKVIPNQIAMLDGELDGIKSRYDQAKPRLARLDEKKTTLVNRLESRIRASALEFDRAARSNINAIIYSIPEWVNSYEPKNSLGWLPTEKKGKIVAKEISDHVVSEIATQQRKWRDGVMVPLLEEKCTYIFDECEHDLKKLFEEIDGISFQISGNESVTVEEVPMWQRIAGAAGGLLFGCPDVALAAGLTGISKDLVKSVGLVLGTELVLGCILGFANPLVLIGGFAAAICNGGLLANSAEKRLKERIIEGMREQLSSGVDKNCTELVNAITAKLNTIVKDMSTAVDNEIAQTKQQVEVILAELNRGRASVDARKREIIACKDKLQSIDVELDSISLELLEK